MIEYIKYHYLELFVYALVIAAIISVIYFLKVKRNRYKLAFYFCYVFYKLGLIKRIPRSYMAIVHAKECNEPLVDLVKHPKIIFNDDTLENPVLLRKSVALKIYKVADNLPDDIYLKLYSAYRSHLALFNVWKEEADRVSAENPGLGRAELLALVNSKVTNSNVNMGGHDTGAAVDLSLCDKDGNDLDFGSKYHEKYNKKNLTKEQKDNSKMLRKIMQSQKFVNLPGQWWHFSYGDKVWAAYKGKRLGAFYAAAEKEFERIGFVKVVKTEITSANIK